MLCVKWKGWKVAAKIISFKRKCVCCTKCCKLYFNVRFVSSVRDHGLLPVHTVANECTLYACVLVHINLLFVCGWTWLICTICVLRHGKFRLECAIHCVLQTIRVRELKTILVDSNAFYPKKTKYTNAFRRWNRFWSSSVPCPWLLSIAHNVLGDRIYIGIVIDGCSVISLSRSIIITMIHDSWIQIVAVTDVNRLPSSMRQLHVIWWTYFISQRLFASTKANNILNQQRNQIVLELLLRRSRSISAEWMRHRKHVAVDYIRIVIVVTSCCHQLVSHSPFGR